jgi:hypothetical protein
MADVIVIDEATPLEPQTEPKTKTQLDTQAQAFLAVAEAAGMKIEDCLQEARLDWLKGCGYSRVRKTMALELMSAGLDFEVALKAANRSAMEWLNSLPPAVQSLLD